METTLETPVITDSNIRSVNFFNGRMLSAEDLIKEKNANRAGQRQLGRSLGDGIAYGLEVTQTTAGTVAQPVVKIAAGLAVNRRGRALELHSEINLALRRPAKQNATTGSSAFEECLPPSTGGYLTSEGIYLLTLAPAEQGEGRATVSGLGNGSVECNVRDRVESVQFYLREVADAYLADLLPDEVSGSEAIDQTFLLRNRVAHAAFGTTDTRLQTWTSSPFAANSSIYGLLDELRKNNQLSECEVPLAILHWTQVGIQFIDMATVRRRIVHPAAPSLWSPLLSDRRAAEMEAMFWQFQEQLRSLGAQPTFDKSAAEFGFAVLPPAGYLPIPNNDGWRAFLGSHAPSDEVPVNAALLPALLIQGLFTEPVQLGTTVSAALKVYRPAGANFVLFARSLQGSLRLKLSTPLGEGQSVQATLTAPQHTLAHRAQFFSGDLIHMEDLPPGKYTVTFATTSFAPVTPVDVEIVAGQITDQPVPLTELANGSLFIRVTNLQGQVLSALANTIEATDTASNKISNATLTGARDKWVFAALPPETYTVTVTVTGYLSGTSLPVFVQKGQVVEQAIVLTPEPAPPTLPDPCITLANVPHLGLKNVRLCLVHFFTEFTDKFFTDVYLGKEEFWYPYPYPSPTPVGPIPPEPDPWLQPNNLLAPEGRYAQPYYYNNAGNYAYNNTVGAAFTRAQGYGIMNYAQTTPPFDINVNAYTYGIPQKYYVYTPRYKGRPKVSFQPWSGMTRLEPLPDDVVSWLAEWRKIIAADFPSQRVEEATPVIFISSTYSPPSSFLDFPLSPQAYAVFGDVSVPMTISTPDMWLKWPIPLEYEYLPGIDDFVIDDLKYINIWHLDDLPGCWAGLLEEVTQKPINYIRYLMDDSLTQVKKLNTELTYYEGIDKPIGDALLKNGLGNDVALANTSVETMIALLAQQNIPITKGQAYRIITQAREIAPEASWSLDATSFSESEVVMLHGLGIESQGEYVIKTETDQASIITALGWNALSAEEQAVQVQTSVQSIIDNMLFNAIESLPDAGVGALPSVDATIAGKLVEAGYDNFEDFKDLTPNDLATAIGITEAEAVLIIADATNANIYNTPAYKVMPIWVGTTTPEATIDPVTGEPAVGMVFTPDVTIGAILDPQNPANVAIETLIRPDISGAVLDSITNNLEFIR
jgi:hypothetical protein